jgi:hypothetical protein
MKTIDTIRRPIRTTLAVLAVAAVPAAAVAVPTFAGTASPATIRTAATTTACPSGWGSLPEAGYRAGTPNGALINVRAGRHTCYDRVVIDFRSSIIGYSVRYVPAVRMEGSGELVPLRGGAKLQIVVTPQPMGIPGHSTYRPANRRELVNVTGFRTLRQIAWAGSFEGRATVGVGVRARLPFRTFTLAGPGSNSRLVIDIAHRWSASPTTTACSSGWGSLPETGRRSGTATNSALINVRAGRHACFDRLVVDFRGGSLGYDVRYVSAVHMDGSGELVPLRGGAKLQIIVTPPDYDSAYQSTYRPTNRRELVNVTGFRTLRQVAHAGSFEGQTTLGAGVRARLPFRVFTLAGPGSGSRLVIDVAHRW